ncbi:MAG: hypothetical protein QOI22_117, partial [Verrucomicrobiota bacterium]
MKSKWRWSVPIISITLISLSGFLLSEAVGRPWQWRSSAKT